MKAKRSLWTSITGGIASASPILFSVCKGGACVGVCISPVASLFGISSASIAASPLISAIEPLLIAISAVSFTVSYYSLYVIPKLNCRMPAGCGCEASGSEKRKLSIQKVVFWLGLLLSLGFLSYFELSKYKAATSLSSECAPAACSEPAEACCAIEDAESAH